MMIFIVVTCDGTIYGAFSTPSKAKACQEATNRDIEMAGGRDLSYVRCVELDEHAKD
jgi:hypothetical protein